MDENKFLGLPKKDAQNLAERFNMIFRLIRVDDQAMFEYPEDKREDRVCIEIEKGKVVKATLQ